MAEIRNYTLNFDSGRRGAAPRGLTCAARKLACAEIALRPQSAIERASVAR
jgi:hypothetical protein